MASDAPGGLCIPLVTPVSADGEVAEEDLRRLVRHAARFSRLLFLCGTTGEWNRLGSASRRAAAGIGIDEGKRIGGGVEIWVGVNAPTVAETLADAAHAFERGADALVAAPLATPGLAIRSFFERDIAGLFARAGRTLSVYLYDNADIAVDPHVPHMHTRDVKALSRLPWIAGIKVSAPRAVLGNYAKAAANWRADFRIFAGHPDVIFEIFRPPSGFWGGVRARWNRYLLQGRLPAGIVAGWANLAPGLWRGAWEACAAGDARLMESFREAAEILNGLSAFRGPDGKTVRKTIACLKEGLRLEGVLREAAVAPGTKGLSPEEAAVFGERWAAWKKTYEGLLEIDTRETGAA